MTSQTNKSYNEENKNNENKDYTKIRKYKSKGVFPEENKTKSLVELL